jgi:hypothetical protein
MKTFVFKHQTILVVLPLLSCAGLVLTGCSTKEPGTPQESLSGLAPTSTAQQSATHSAGIFDGLKACDLLAPITSVQGYDSPAPEDLESDNGCLAAKPRYGNVALYLVDKSGIGSLSTQQGIKTQTQVSGRDAVQLSGDGGKGSCFIGLAVTPDSRATVSLTLSSGTNDQACTDAKVIAEQIAPKLPKGN